MLKDSIIGNRQAEYLGGSEWRTAEFSGYPEQNRGRVGACLSGNAYMRYGHSSRRRASSKNDALGKTKNESETPT